MDARTIEHGPRNPREVISFLLGAQEFCVDVVAVREIRSWVEPTPLPHAPRYLRGMINLRGTVLPIVDMTERMGLTAAGGGQRQVIVVVWIGSRVVGLLVDAVCDIISVPDGALQPVPDFCADAIRGFASGVMTLEGRMMCLIALENLLPEVDAAA